MKFLKKSAIAVMAATIISANAIGCVPMKCVVNPVLSASAADIVDSGECGAEGSNLTWTLDSEGTLTISGEGEMPEWKYSDSPWYDNDSILKVIIGKGVKNIAKNAFNSCAITEVSISETVENIQIDALSLYYLKNINVDENNKNYKSVDGILFDRSMSTLLNYPCQKEGSLYEIPNSVTAIGKEAFDNVLDLETVIIPNSVTNIGENAFSYCGIKEVKIPASVTTIGDEAFMSSGRLENIEVDEANKYYKSVDDVLFDKDMKTLIAYPYSKKNVSYTIPNGVTSIGLSAFHGSRYLKNVTLSDTVTIIEERAFFSCSNFESIVITDNVTEIGNSVFYGDSKLASVKLPKSVGKIGLNAFGSCNSLALIEIENPECDIYDYSATIYKTAVISGYSGSTAQAYAEKYERNFVPLGDKPATPAYQLGDANADGKIDSSDASLILAEYAIIQTGANTTFTDAQKLAADVNKDGSVASTDASKILAYYADSATGKEPSWD